jgi:hypothetical protein
VLGQKKEELMLRMTSMKEQHQAVMAKVRATIVK